MSHAAPGPGLTGTDLTGTGLTSAEAAELLLRHGPNQLAEPQRRSALMRFIDQFRDGIVYILVVAAVVAGAIGDLKDTVVIAVVLVVNAILGYIQEARAEGALEALNRMLVTRAKVRRDGRITELDHAQLVPGDVVLVEAGDRIPADGKLLEAVHFAVDESMLTGESEPVHKHLDADDAVMDSVFMNTTVTAGRCEFVVTATGMNTEVGRVAEMLNEADPGPTPLQRQLNRLGRQLTVVAIVAVSLVLALQVIRGVSFSEALIGAVVLAVAAIPEGLPAVVTVTLAVGVSQMAKRNAIVKRLHSVETLGSTTVICSDKTGTLTQNQMTARFVVVGSAQFAVSGEGYNPSGEITPVAQNEPREHGTSTVGKGVSEVDLTRALLAGVLCSEAVLRQDERGQTMLVGDPTEGALLVAAIKAGVDVDAVRTHMERLSEVPFDSAVKYMATLNACGADIALSAGNQFTEGADDVVLFAKGAPDVLVPRCTHLVDASGGRVQFDDAARDEMRASATELSAQGLRVLALVSRELDRASIVAGGRANLVDADADGEGLEELIDGLTLECLVAVVDPVRPEAREAVRLCRRAGITVKMITGDSGTTAKAIATELGIEGRVVTGADLSAMDDDELAAEIDSIGVCARVSPEHKVRVIAALKVNGHVVAMTGDGVNDAAALRSADIGVAMGINGTEVTKEAADLVLTDDNFATIVGAVERGRTIYDNIIKFVRFQLSTNLGAILTVLGASMLGMPTPFTPIQILWVNLVGDGPPAMTLGVDPPAADVMDRTPRREEDTILGAKRMAHLTFFGLVMAIGTLGVFAYADSRWDAKVAGTMAFQTFVLFQMFNVFNARREHTTALTGYSLKNRSLLVAIAGVVILQVLAVIWGPMRSLFDTVQISGVQWLICIGAASSVLWAEEIRKLIVRVIGR